MLQRSRGQKVSEAELATIAAELEVYAKPRRR
jgi:hypothetical protein